MQAAAHFDCCFVEWCYEVFILGINCCTPSDEEGRQSTVALECRKVQGSAVCLQYCRRH